MFRLFLEKTASTFSFDMWGFRLLLYYNLLIRAFMRNQLTHAEVSTRGIQIHPYSQVCSTDFVRGVLQSTTLLCSRPSQPHLIFRTCLSQMPSPGMFCTPAITPARGVTDSSGFSFWVSPVRREVLRLSSSEWVFGVLILFLKVQYQLYFFLFPLSAAPQGKKQLDNSSISEGSCTSPPHTLPSLKVNAVSVGSIHRALRANQISSAVRKKYDLPEGKEAQLWVTRKAVLNSTVSEESNDWMVWPIFVCVVRH